MTRADYAEYKTWEICDIHPKYRQTNVDSHYIFDAIEEKWKTQKKVALYKGSVKNWAVLDSTHTLEQRNNLQKHIGDSRSATDSMPEGQTTTAIEVKRETLFVEDNENEEEVELPLRSQYI